MLSRLKLTRLEQGMSQLALGIRADVHPNKISLAERHLGFLTPQEEQRIAAILKADQKWLFGDLPESLPFGGMQRRSDDAQLA